MDQKQIYFGFLGLAKTMGNKLKKNRVEKVNLVLKYYIKCYLQ